MLRKGKGMEIKETLLDKIIVLLYYLIIAAGIGLILLEVMVSFKHGVEYAGLLGVAFVLIWSRARDVINRRKDDKFYERHNSYCKSCKYMKENEIK